MNVKPLAAIIILCCFAAIWPIGRQPLASTARHPDVAQRNPDPGWWARQPKEQKLVYTTAAAASVIGLWGLVHWDYGSSGWSTADEGWFGADSKYGGADKLGHFWSTYALSDGLTALYQSWGYNTGEANTYGALCAWSVQALMEIFDGSSDSQGFSAEDMVMNTIGALTSIFLERFPELDRKIDFRVEYVFNVPVDGIFDDYSNQFYSLVIKLEGFPAVANSVLRYLEVQGGYYSRGYDTIDVAQRRAIYAGISLNFSRLLSERGWSKTAKVVEYIQVPYTVPKASIGLE